MKRVETPVTRSLNDVKPVIHVSSPSNKQEIRTTQPPARQIARARSPAARVKSAVEESRRFHISKPRNPSDGKHSQGSGVTKRARQNDTIFVESSKRRMNEQLRNQRAALQLSAGDNTHLRPSGEAIPESKTLKKPSSMSRLRGKGDSSSGSTPARTPMPVISRQNSNLEEIASEMNQWVLKEIGANLEGIKKEKQREIEIEKAKTLHKVPKPGVRTLADRLRERTEAQATEESEDVKMSEDDGDDEDWIIEEYVRVPAYSIVNPNPEDVGVLILEGEDDNFLFYGPENDEEDEWEEDDEDENGESLPAEWLILINHESKY